MSPRRSISWELTGELAPRDATRRLSFIFREALDECAEGVSLPKYSGRKPSRNMAL